MGRIPHVKTLNSNNLNKSSSRISTGQQMGIALMTSKTAAVMCVCHAKNALDVRFDWIRIAPVIDVTVTNGKSHKALTLKLAEDVGYKLDWLHLLLTRGNPVWFTRSIPYANDGLDYANIFLC